ncbi:hypothetical protein [Streptomyces sp. NPDC023838]|uniref:hypothetical protein n=1 Tax=Streptomyces sp. NPDC023838 TaxID=3154325 RepID=UPI0033C6697F
MFGAKSREIARLRDLVQVRTDQRDDARKLAGIHSGALHRVATQNVDAASRHRAELAAKDRRIAALQRRLDDATGLSNPSLDAGARWQERRADKPRSVAQ